jgi:hypothetical protein
MMSISFRAIMAVTLVLAAVAFAAPALEKRAIDPTAIVNQLTAVTSTINGLLSKVQALNTSGGASVAVSCSDTFDIHFLIAK